MPAETIVIYRLGSLGDSVAALPCFNLVAEVFPGARRVILTNRPVSDKAAPVLAVLGLKHLVHAAIEYPLGQRSPLAFLRLAIRLRKLKATTLIYMSARQTQSQVRRDVAFFRLCGFRNIVGEPVTNDLLENLVEGGVVESESRRLARCLAPLGHIDLEARKWWDLHLDETEVSAGVDGLGALKSLRFIAVHMGGKAIEKDWGDENWRKLIIQLGRRYTDFGLAAVGAQTDVEKANGILSLWPGPTANLCGSLSPRECAAALGRSSLFIGHDSGPLHLAAAMGVPCLGLFGDYNKPVKWHPIGPKVVVIHQLLGMGAIPVSAVLDSARLLLLQSCGGQQG